MKILIFGSNGQIGRELQRTLPFFGQIIPLESEDCDLRDTKKLRDLLYAQAPSVIVNAAGCFPLNDMEEVREAVFQVNANAPKIMADYSRYNGSLLIHYSADDVFDGKKTDAYLENDEANPLNIFGQSKRAAEEFIQDAGCHHLIFRTNCIYSVHGSNFAKDFLNFSKDNTEFQIDNDSMGAPTSAELIADITALAIMSWRTDMLPEGVYHLTASGRISRTEFSYYLLEKARTSGINLKLENITSVSNERRNACLNNDKLIKYLGFQMPDWKIHADRFISQLIGRRFFY